MKLAQALGRAAGTIRRRRRYTSIRWSRNVPIGGRENDGLK